MLLRCNNRGLVEGLILRLRVRRLGLMAGARRVGVWCRPGRLLGSGLGQSAVAPRPFICIWWGMAGGVLLGYGLCLTDVAHCLIDCVWSSGWGASCHLG